MDDFRKLISECLAECGPDYGFVLKVYTTGGHVFEGPPDPSEYDYPETLRLEGDTAIRWRDIVAIEVVDVR